MKKFVTILIVLACILSVSMTALAANSDSDSEFTGREPLLNNVIESEVSAYTEDSADESALKKKDSDSEDILKEEPNNDESLSPVNGKYKNIGALYQHWEANGYPDYVGFVFSTDENENNLTVLIVENNDTAENQIRSMLISDSGLSFGIAKYSYNELKAIADKISSDYLGKNEQVYTVGVGWTSIDGEVVGFGDSGKEPRVVVGVDKSILTEYTNQFEKFYGDMAVVEESDAPMRAIANDNGTGLFLLLIPMVLLAGASILFFNRSRLIPAMQTTSGSVITQSAPVSKKQMIEVVKNSAITPSDDMFNSIMEKIEKTQK